MLQFLPPRYRVPDATINMRVMYVIPGEESGASMVFARRQAEALSDAGVDVDVFFLRSRLSPWHLLKEWIRFDKRISAFRPDLIHAQYGTMTAFFTGLGSRCPVFVTFRGSDLNPSPDVGVLRSKLGKALSQVAAARANRVICVSSRLRDKLWLKREEDVVLPNGTDLTLFKPEPLEAARRRLGWPMTEKVVLFNAGRNPKVKRLDLAQAAVSSARDLGQEIRLDILNGDTPPNAVPSHLNGANCLLLTSDWEGSPDIVKEALACNLPIVSVDVGDTAERLQGVSLSQIVPRDAKAIGEALAKTLSLGGRSNGRDIIALYSTPNVTTRLIHIYRETLQGNR